MVVVTENCRVHNHTANKTLLRSHIKQSKRNSRRKIGQLVRCATTTEVVTRQVVTPLTPKDFVELDQGYCNIVQKYSPSMIREMTLQNPWDLFKVFGRVVEIVSKIGGYVVTLGTDEVVGVSDTKEIVIVRAAQLRQLLTDLGPSFIKAGQVLANRPDIVREDYMNELCTLQDDVPPFPDEVALQIMEEELGRPIGDVFSSISEAPIAAASLGQVYKAVLRDTGEEVAIKVQRPGVEPQIVRDLFIFRIIAQFLNGLSIQRLGCNAALIVDEFGEKIMEELDYSQEAQNIQDFYNNFLGDKLVKIPWVRKDLSSRRVLVLEWIDGVRCTDVKAVQENVNVDSFIRTGVVAGLRQLLEFGLFHGDPHPGNIFALRDGRIAYVDFGNVATISQYNKEVLIDAVVHAVNRDYQEMAEDFIKLGFLAPGTDLSPIVPALEKIWSDSLGRSLGDFNFRTVTSKFNELVYEYPIRIPERYSLVIRSLLTQEGICMTLNENFRFLEVAYPYVARRLLTDEQPALRRRLFSVLFKGGSLQWTRLENLLGLAKQGGAKLDLNQTATDGLKVLLTDENLRTQLILAFTEGNRLHIEEVNSLLELVKDDLDVNKLVQDVVFQLPQLTRQVALQWSDRVLSA
eukprot:TRINITY_DN5847_c2_g1_i2.p1 TRINITY_DN5847_c2_g1~~TRINITY_DN5847_c2_g1_i2.p1  ORF type:complete len:630 (-),score=81.06 TRINITY_DN5847_c2_g1_i2:444-2333(-)